MPESCSTCRFWRGPYEDDVWGSCRAHSPRHGEPFPQTVGNDWCGEYEAVKESDWWSRGDYRSVVPKSEAEVVEFRARVRDELARMRSEWSARNDALLCAEVDVLRLYQSSRSDDTDS